MRPDNITAVNASTKEVVYSATITSIAIAANTVGSGIKPRVPPKRAEAAQTANAPCSRAAGPRPEMTP